jgi:hypothetical protein
MSPSSLRPFIGTVLRHPGVLVEAVAAGWSARPVEGWRSLVPIPERDYWDWRLHTAYGDREPDPEDTVEVLRWRRRMRRTA